MDEKIQRILSSLPYFVAAGRTGDTAKLNAATLPRIGTFGAVRDDWNQLLEGWPLDDVRDLVRGVVLAERDLPNYKFGSVSPASRIFSVYLSRAPRSASQELGDWVLLNTVNDYLPYGTSNHFDKLRLHRQQIELSKPNTTRREVPPQEPEGTADPVDRPAHDAT